MLLGIILSRFPTLIVVIALIAVVNAYNR